MIPEEFYKELLKKYMQHVLDCEGMTFVPEAFYSEIDGRPITVFNPKEQKALLETQKSL